MMTEILSSTFPFALILFVVLIAVYFALACFIQAQEKKIQRIALKQARVTAYRKGLKEGEENAWMKRIGLF